LPNPPLAICTGGDWPMLTAPTLGLKIVAARSVDLEMLAFIVQEIARQENTLQAVIVLTLAQRDLQLQFSATQRYSPKVPSQKRSLLEMALKVCSAASWKSTIITTNKCAKSINVQSHM
jgi:hypothetical protein